MFITMEGIDGSGKSTQAERAFTFLGDILGTDNVIWTREPGDWVGGMHVRQLLLKTELTHPLSELFLFLVDRCEHVYTKIIPALNEGKVVLCERYTDSTLAYQSWGRGISLEKMQDLFAWCSFPVPDLTLWLDVPVELSLNRINNRGDLDRIESVGSDFLGRVCEGYQNLMSKEPDRIKRIDASTDMENVYASIKQYLEGILDR
jgi:dTMP kinase